MFERGQAAAWFLSVLRSGCRKSTPGLMVVYIQVIFVEVFYIYNIKTVALYMYYWYIVTGTYSTLNGYW